MANDRNQFELSALEAEILMTVDHIGWYACLWFPIAHREMLNSGSDASDQQVHAAFASLIRTGALTCIVRHQYRRNDIPEWKLVSGALEIAQDVKTLSNVRTQHGLSTRCN